MSRSVYDRIKIKYTSEGYLPNYPYHMISDKEMCDAFISRDSDKEDYFHATYPLPDDQFREAYTQLEENIYEVIRCFLLPEGDEKIAELPDWVCSYMLGVVINTHSSEIDIHDYLVLMDRDNINDIITPEVYSRCYQISAKWLSKLHSKDTPSRVPTIFGEPHVIKSLRIDAQI